jgi:hypothetical protein
VSHLVGHFREDLRLEQVQPLEILLHHD